jgi:hypothetical protein
MSRKSLLLAIAIVLGLVGGATAVLAVLLRHEPAFYLRSAVTPGDYRKKCSDEFESEFYNRLVGGVANKRQWDARFTEDQINSYFEEGFVQDHNAERPLPEWVHQPRVALEQDQIRLGFRYGTGIWSTVVSIDLRAWLVAKEPNVVALEFQGIHAGALPISTQWFLDQFFEAARQRDSIDPTWYRHKGHPVLVLRFQADRSHPTFQLQRLDLRPGMLLITGRSLDSMTPVVPPSDGN